MGFRKEDDLLNQLQVPSSIDKFISELPDRYKQGALGKETVDRIDQEYSKFQKDVRKKNWSVGKKLTTISASLAAACGLFIGSAFFSPAMAQIASKIPYLNMMFESNPIIQEISDSLNKKGYQWDGLSVMVLPREISVQIIGTNDYYEEVKGPVEELIKSILSKREYDAYEVEVLKGPEDFASPAIDNDMDTYEQITKVVEGILKDYGYEGVSNLGLSGEQVEFELPNTETKIDEIKSKVVQTLKDKGVGTFKLKVYTFNPELREQEARWMPIINNIGNGLSAKKEYFIKTVGYSNKMPIEIVIRTTLSQSDSRAQETAEKIQQNIIEFLASEKVKTLIKEDSYHIKIYSEDKKVLKELTK